MPILVKKIKPQRLKSEVFRTQLIEAMNKAGEKVKEDFEATVSTWKHKPKFEVLVSLSGPGPELLVDTDDEIYRYVSEGTRPHPIFAGIYTGKSNKRVLAFKSRYTAKTRPGVIGSFPGGSSGSDVRRPFVMHPGTKERGFDVVIKKKREPWFKRQMEEAMKVAAQKSGWG